MGNILVAAGLNTTRFKDDDEDLWQALWRASVAEFFAMLIFVFIGTGSVVAAKTALGEDNIAVASISLIAMAHGFAIMVMVYSIGEISGAHINPAVTLALLITDRISVIRAVVYFCSQIIGAICGSGILKGLIPDAIQFTLGCHSVNPAITQGQAVGLEIVFTFILVYVIFATAISPFVGKIAPLAGGEYGPGKLTPFAIGMTVMILHLVGISFTGASMNPARSFGPAVVHGCWESHWVYWIGPFVGCALAAMTASLVFLSTPGQITRLLTMTRGLDKKAKVEAEHDFEMHHPGYHPEDESLVIHEEEQPLTRRRHAEEDEEITTSS